MKKYRVSQKELLTDAVDETIPGKIWKKYLDTKIKMLQTNCLEHGVFYLPPAQIFLLFVSIWENATLACFEALTATLP